MPALIFDLDGTLVDSAPDLLGAMNAVLHAEGRPGVDPTTLRHMVGFGARSLIEQAMTATGAPASPSRLPELVESFVVHYREHLADRSRPFPHVEATLAKLAASGARMGVLTNKPQDLVRPLLDKLDLSRFFGAVHGAGRFAYVKPDARVFHHVIDDLGGPGRGAVMIGDSKTDLLTGRAANAPVILLSYGYTPEPARDLGADTVLDDFADIPAAVERLLRK